MAQTDIEKTSLEAHVSLCELRYQALEHRLTQVETQLVSLQTLLSEIRDTLARLPAQQIQVQDQRWQRFQWWLIGILGAVAGWALTVVLHPGLPR